jgi:[ribosomal protein S18]-alanine N-acetyltransferase
MSDLEWTQMTRDMLDPVAAIEQHSGDVGWTRGQFEKELTLPMSRFFVLQQGGNILGYGGFWKVNDEAQIINLVISHSERRKGKGLLLLKHLLDQALAEGCTQMTLEVRSKNKAALSLYQKAGFTEQTRRPKAYRQPEDDAVLMEKIL